MRPVRTCRGAMLASLAAAALGGCPKCPDTMVPMDRLVDDYNANAARVPRLKASAKIAATITDSKGRSFPWGSTSPLARPNGVLMLGKGPGKLGPHNFVLIGRETASVELFRVGSNAEEGLYYFWFRFGKHGQAWWGRNELAGAPGVEGLPMEPGQLLAVLSVCELPTDYTDAPTVAMTMDTDPKRCAYVLTYIDRQPITRRLGFRREVYFHWGPDKKPPFLVRFFDNRGRRIMTAHLDKYRPVRLGDDAPEGASAPVMPTDIRIDWPERKSSVHLVLSDMTIERIGNPKKATRFEAYAPPDIPKIQVDAHIRRGGPDR